MGETTPAKWWMQPSKVTETCAQRQGYRPGHHHTRFCVSLVIIFSILYQLIRILVCDVKAFIELLSYVFFFFLQSYSIFSIIMNIFLYS